jgi:chitodextrinase
MKNYFFKSVLLCALLFGLGTVLGQTKKQKKQITSRYDNQKIQQLASEFSQKTSAEKQKAIQLAKTNNWPITIQKNGTYAELQKVVNGKPIYYTTFNVNAAKSTRANFLNSGGGLGLSLNGQNMTAHIWDGGLARSTHQEYDGTGGNNRFSIGDGSTTLHYHSAHVTGTIIASGVQANAKGMAPHASAVGYDWNSDTTEATTAAGNGMLISNHSYGFAARDQFGNPQLPDYYFGGYITDSRDWDQIMFNAPNYLMVVAAGNDGDDNTANGAPLNGNSSYDKLSGHATAKNNLVVANAQDANIDASGNLVSVSINSSSSEGPTDDLRIKPDITGNGTNVYSTYESSDTAYNSITGTSMASPNVAGTLILLQQHANNVNGSFMRAATLKGLALHTADDAGSTGPDAIFGWGLLNAKKAAEAITNNGNESIINELTLTSGQTYQITVDSDGINDLYASISWTDRAGTATTTANSSTAVLVNDLDIRVTKGGTTYSPWRLTGVTTNGKGDNIKDPYERVDVANASGTYTITITHKGSLTGGSQNYTLIVTGLTGTPVACNATTPTGLSIDGFGSSTATASWNAVAGASYDFRYRQTGTSTWTTSAISGTTVSLTGLTPLTQYEVQVRSKCPDNSTSAYSSSVTFTTTEVQLNYCSSQSSNVNDEYISRVQLNTIDNSSGAQFYSDFTNISTSLTKGSAYTITITPTWTGTIYNEGYSVWIDYNHDGDFTDAGEQVWSKTASKTTPVSGSFTIPAGATVSSTRMRVSMEYNTIPTSCKSFTYGEVEDYTINITGATADTEAPSAPSSLAASGTTETSTNLSWTASTDNVGVTGYDVYRGATLIASVTTTSYTATGLTVNTSYNFSVKAKDAAGNISASSNTVSVTTIDTTAPSSPTSLAASNIAQTTLTLNWSASTDNVAVTSYDIYQGSTNIGNVSGTSTNITGLTANTAYTFKVKAKDAAGNTSGFSNTANATTLPTAGGSGCTGGITAFPYSEGYENTLGAWTQSTADDINWTVDANGTPSGSTGPSSASQGTYYVYVEASGNGTGYPNKQAILNSPCYDLSGETEATFAFKYHMYGSTDMGSIALEASDDNGTTWTSLWSQTGNKGNSWLSASINLSAYLGGTVQLRFNRITGGTWQADIAIDDVSLSTGATGGGGNTTVALSITFDNYPEETSWEIQDNSSNIVASGGTYASQADGSTLNINVDLPVGCYSFIMKDAYGDGMCCTYGNGSYTLTDTSNSQVLASGGTFTNTDTTSFCVGGAVNSFNFVTTDHSNYQPTIGFNLYPNPVNNTLTVSLFGADAQSFKIINMLGQVVMNGNYKQTLDVSSLKSGVYVLQVNIGEKNKIKRFIKQ